MITKNTLGFSRGTGRKDNRGNVLPGTLVHFRIGKTGGTVSFFSAFILNSRKGKEFYRGFFCLFEILYGRFLHENDCLKCLDFLAACEYFLELRTLIGMRNLQMTDCEVRRFQRRSDPRMHYQWIIKGETQDEPEHR